MLFSVKDFTRLLILLTAFYCVIDGQSQIRSYCQGASTSCGHCLKAHSDCAWCTDTSFPSENRCDSNEYLKETCPKFLVHQATSKIEITQDKPLGSPHPYLQTSTQLEPQQLQLTMKPGETLTFQLKYAHLDTENSDVYILNSETESQGLRLELTSDCPRPQQQDDARSCTGVRPSDILTYNISLTLIDCITSGDAVVSVGIGGVRDVVAVYITPVCGCECEKLAFQELQSQTCSRNGNLVCGKCVCKEGMSGKFCECDDKTTGGDTNCRSKPGDPVCSMHGACSCGRCLCQESFYGQFCECSNENCPKTNGQLCSGNGHCQCGQCICTPGWSGTDCSCSLAQDTCLSKNGKLCNDAGYCQCNKCVCQQSGDHLDATCESHTAMTDDHFTPMETDMKEPTVPMTGSMESKHDEDTMDPHHHHHQTPSPNHRYEEEDRMAPRPEYEPPTTPAYVYHEEKTVAPPHVPRESQEHVEAPRIGTGVDKEKSKVTDVHPTMAPEIQDMYPTMVPETKAMETDMMEASTVGPMMAPEEVPNVVHSPLGHGQPSESQPRPKSVPEQHGEAFNKKNKDKVMAAGQAVGQSGAPISSPLARFTAAIFALINLLVVLFI